MNTPSVWIVEEECCDGHTQAILSTEEDAKRVTEELTRLNNMDRFGYYEAKAMPSHAVDDFIQELKMRYEQ